MAVAVSGFASSTVTLQVMLPGADGVYSGNSNVVVPSPGASVTGRVADRGPGLV
jgi:hypothetical protein